MFYNLVWRFNKLSSSRCKNPNFSGYIGFSILFIFLGLIVHFVDFSSFEQKINFWFRASVGKSPDVHEKIKIFGHDDITISWRHKNNRERDLNIEEWARVLKDISSRKPRAIIVSKVFSGVDRLSIDKRKKVTDLLKSIDIPIITGSFHSTKKLRYREMLDFSLQSYNVVDSLSTKIRSSIPSDAPIIRGHIYGPDDFLKTTFTNVGHFSSAKNGRIAPFYRFKNDYFLPYFVFLANKDLFFDPGFELPLSKKGELIVNYSEVSQYFKKIKPLYAIAANKTKDSALKAIKEGDFVFILPKFYTGSIKPIETPLKLMPVEIASIAILNSSLTAEWIKPVNFLDSLIWIYIVAVVSIFIVMYFPAKKSAFIGVVISLLIVCAGMTVFGYYGLELYWHKTFGAFFFAFVFCYAIKAILVERESKNLQIALSGLISPDKMELVSKDPSTLNLDPSQRFVTIMFIDIVNFTYINNQLEDERTFVEVKDYINHIASIILKWGGAIDRTIGDGLLCMFGFELNKDESAEKHADNALECAKEIQQLCYEKYSVLKEGQAMMPLRIGVNTDNVVIGNFGNEKRIDITMLGEAVIYAKRIESSCTPFKVMISESTHEHLSKSDIKKDLIRRYIQIKHEEKLKQAYEFNPFAHDPKQFDLLLQNFMKYRGLSVRENRIPIDPKKNAVMYLRGHVFTIHDVSLSGFLVSGPMYLGREVTLQAEINVIDSDLRSDLYDMYLSPFSVRVKSGKECNDRSFYLGLEIVGLNGRQKEKIFNMLLDRLGMPDLKV